MPRIDNLPLAQLRVRPLRRRVRLLRCRISWYIRFEVTCMTFTVEYEREDDGRWLAEVVELGVLAYGKTSDEAIAKAQALALRVLADRLEHGESASEFVSISFAAA
ncbi:MAG: type II toxin-antitoxin system HicB family antitoxin [Pyrinomonadaceae bacterium]